MPKQYIKHTSIEKIREDCDIVKVAEKYGISVKKAGVRYKAICPFHDDHTPSLNFFSESNQCYCFSCGGHADVIGLVQKTEGYDFREAVEAIAKDFSIELEYEEMTDEQEQAYKKRESLFANMAAVEEFYRREFLKNDKAKQYAYDRWGKEFCNRMRVGYAPDSICSLSGLGIKPEILQELGLTNANHDDIFRARLTLSIRDKWGHVIGFTCRSLDGTNPKYKNNADSEIFHKGEVLFGVDMAWRTITKTQTAYLVEGAPDCYRLQSIGIMNTVACLGTAWSHEHFTKLNKVATKVVFIPDSDVVKPGEKMPPGTEAVIKGGKLALQHGLAVYVKEIPKQGNEKQDADSYFTDKEVFDGVHEQDFVIWYAGKQFDTALSVEEKSHAVNCVVCILADLNDQTKSAFYVTELSKKYTEGKRKVWNEALKKANEANKIPRCKTNSAIATNTSDPKSFGFEIEKRKYIISNEYGTKELSNFILIPEFHVLDSVLSRRIFTIENDRGDKKIIELRPEELVSNDKFRAKLIDTGNFSWKGGKDDLMKLVSYLMANTDTAQQIRQLGWQQQGFFAFGNGIVNGKEWHEANDCGIVKLEDKGNYYLPSHSLICRYDRKMFVFEHNFVYREGATVTMREVANQIFEVFGDNGRIAFLFLLACIFHDIVAYTPQPGWFPLLDLFGPMGTGKTALAETMAAFFTKKKSINIDNATVAAMSDEVAAAANAVVVLNEYKNAIDDSKVEFLKGTWDLIGRTRMSLNKDGQKEMTAVDSGIILTGQEMPTKDNALFSRTIFLTFSNSQFSQEQSEEFQKLAQMREHGLTHLTIELLQYREKMEKEYPAAFYEACKLLKAKTHSASEMERIINNWAVLLAIYKVLSKDLNIDIDYNSITSFVRNGIRRQSISCKTSDEMASFWNTLQFLLSCKSIFRDAHYRVVARKYLSTKDGKEYVWDDFHSVIFVRKAGIIEIYQEACRRIGNAFIPKESLEFYLTHASYYLGTGKQRFNETDRHGCVDFENGRVKTTSQWAYYFDYEAVKRLYEIDLDPPVVTEEDENAQEQELDLQTDEHGDVPF